jgi:hypothetical protein
VFEREGGGGGGSQVETAEMNHLWLTFGCKGGGGGGSRVETPKKNYLRLTLGCEGGGGGRSRIETTTVTTSGSHLDAREVVVGGSLGVTGVSSG